MALFIPVCVSLQPEASRRALRSPPGLNYSLSSQLTTDDSMTDWLRLLMETDHGQGEVTLPAGGDS